MDKFWNKEGLEFRIFRFATLNCPTIIDQIMVKGCLLKDD